MISNLNELEDRFVKVKTRIVRYCTEFHRDPNDIELLAVSKGQPIASIKALYELGQRDFAENYLQELIEKAIDLPLPGIKWHFIGQLQSNKINRAVTLCQSIQTVAQVKHALKIASAAIEMKRTPYPVYLALNAENEPRKAGCNWTEAEAIAHAINGITGIILRGLMVVPPEKYQDPLTDEDSCLIPELYHKLGELKNRIGEGHLSLGMSGDMRIAIGAGSTCVRVGTALFGDRT